MKKIQHKLVLSYALIALLSIVLVAVPTIASQVSELEKNVSQIASGQLSEAKVSINNFLNTPAQIVRDIGIYARRADATLHQKQVDLNSLIKSTPYFYCAYYTGTLPVKDGGSTNGFLTLTTTKQAANGLPRRLPATTLS